MRTIEQINSEYGALCAKLGENTYRLRALRETETKLLQAIEALEAEARSIKSEEKTDE